MIERIIDISEEPIFFSVANALVSFKKKDGAEITVPVNEIGCIICSHPLMTFTLNALSSLAAEGVPVIVCNNKHMPSGMLIPYAGHFAQLERFTVQINAPKPLLKRLWQQVVSSKIKVQGLLLDHLYGNDFGLKKIAGKVQSGDSTNIESWASRIYWEALRNDFPGGRDRTANDHNRFLNYGYAVLRAVVCRATCGAGLHPTIGIHHHNRYDQFCLADDIMEPLRPLIDHIVITIVKKHGAESELNRLIKMEILSFYKNRLSFHGEYRNIFDVCSKMASSLVRTFEKKEKMLMLPDSIETICDSNEEEGEKG